MLIIRRAEQHDRRAWQMLWHENCKHFGAEGMTRVVIDGLWQRLMDPEVTMTAWLAFSEGEPVGLAHTILHPHTFSLRPVCYLEDLWISPTSRRTGVATKLIAHLKALGEQEGWRRLYWETGSENEAAQRLYSRIAQRRPILTYQIEITA